METSTQQNRPLVFPASYKKLWSKKMRNIDASIDSRRAAYGFSQNGSDYYPIPSKGSTLVTYGGR